MNFIVKTDHYTFDETDYFATFGYAPTCVRDMQMFADEREADLMHGRDDDCEDLLTLIFHEKPMGDE